MSKFKPTFKRILEVILTFLIVSLLSFGLMRMSPVDPATAYARRAMMNPSAEQIAQIRSDMGLNKAFIVQYGNWMKNALKLDFGKSLVDGKPVWDQLLNAVPVTIKVVFIAMILEIIGIILFGPLLYLLREKKVGMFFSLLTLSAISIPGFYIASVYLDIFAVKWGAISVAGNVGFMKYFHPAICLSIAPMAFYARLLFRNLERESDSDYVFYARCRGLSEIRILFNHTIAHGIIALVPSFLQSIGLTLAGAAMIERVFSLPGLGYLIIDSVLNRDSPMIHLSVLFLAVMLVIFNVLSDYVQELLQKNKLIKSGDALC
ncbi:MAG: ABC transporter permease [Maledivibacter sp.]|jgi:ABC-type dipeptide/oligopeptide/nickel transport system permease component|nr:ABC transporter permease [Maledivibacter sp.]